MDRKQVSRTPWKVDAQIQRDERQFYTSPFEKSLPAEIIFNARSDAMEDGKALHRRKKQIPRCHVVLEQSDEGLLTALRIGIVGLESGDHFADGLLEFVEFFLSDQPREQAESLVADLIKMATSDHV